MKDNIVAKLSGHCDDLMAEVMKLMQKESVRTLWDKDWLALISGKQAFYNGLSQYHQSKAGMATGFMLSKKKIDHHIHIHRVNIMRFLAL